MRFEVSKSDLDSKRFARAAKALQKNWSPSRLTLMQAQNILSKLLGYRDLYDLQACAANAATVEIDDRHKPERLALIRSIAWTANREYHIPLREALALAKSIPLIHLDFDKQTRDWASEERVREEQSRGIYLILDEYNYYLDAKNEWTEKTPQLLEAGAPPYKLTLLPEGRALRWSELLKISDNLPDDLAAKLSAGRGNSNQECEQRLIVDFYRSEVIPSAIEDEVVALSDSRKRPNGFKVLHWPKNGCVLYNHALGGITPVVYDEYSNYIYKHMAQVMRGQIPQIDLKIFSPADSMWHEKQGCENDSRDRVPADYGSFSISPEVNGIAPTFCERGQTYIRCFNWMDEQSIPLLYRNRISLVATKPTSPSEDAIPDWHNQFHLQTCKFLEDELADAKSVIGNSIGDGSIINFILDLVGNVDVESIANAEVADIHRYGEDEDANLDLIRAIAHYRVFGAEITKDHPALSALGDLYLGWMVYKKAGTYYEARDSYLASYNEADSTSYWATVILHICAARTGEHHTTGPLEDKLDEIRMVVGALIARKVSAKNVLEILSDIHRFTRRSREQKRHIHGISDWRAQEQAQDEIREAGKYLYAVGPVSPVNTGSPLESAMREWRKYSVEPLMATQNLENATGDYTFGDEP